MENQSVSGVKISELVYWFPFWLEFWTLLNFMV